MHFIKTIILSALALPLLVLGHGAGETWEREVNGYLIDVGYNSFSITEDELVRYDFQLLNVASKVEAPFDTVGVRIRDEDRIVYAFDLPRAKLGPTYASITMPYAGVFTISLDYHLGTTTLASSTFEFDVNVPDEEADPYRFFLVPAALVLSLILAFGTHWFINRKT